MSIDVVTLAIAKKQSGTGGATEEQIENAVKNYMEQNPIKVTTDKTLTKEDEPADAKIVGENIKKGKMELDEISKRISVNEKNIETNATEISEIKKKVSIDTYEELAKTLADGTIENYVSVGDELMVNKLTGLSIMSNNKNLSFVIDDEQKFIKKIGLIDDKIYIFSYAGQWTYLGQPVKIEEFGFSVTGTPTNSDSIFVKMNYTQVSHTFVDFNQSGENAIHPVDKNVKHFALLEQTYVTDSLNFDYPESAICVTVGYTLKAGKYYIYNVKEATNDFWCNYKRLYYTFEIFNDITATEETGDIQLRFISRGDNEKDGDERGYYVITCKPYCCKPDTLYNSDVIIFEGVVTQPGEEYKDLRTINNFSVNQSMKSEGVIYNNIGHVCFGNNEWNVSNLRQAMNSDAKKIIPTRMHKNDVLTGISSTRGNMWGLDPRFVNLIKKCNVCTQHGISDEFTQYDLYSCEDTATLLSMKEMSFYIQINEGVTTKLYSTYTNDKLSNLEIASRGKASRSGETQKYYRWSRSADSGYSSVARGVSPAGSITSSTANDGYRFAPAYIIGVANHPESNQSVEA